jgi:hypothetical protein
MGFLNEMTFLKSGAERFRSSFFIPIHLPVNVGCFIKLLVGESTCYSACKAVYIGTPKIIG